MSQHLGEYNTNGDSQSAVIKNVGDDGVAETVIVLSEMDGDNLTSGQLSFFHNVEKGDTPGTWC